jgi:hypothetical protein
MDYLENIYNPYSLKLVVLLKSQNSCSLEYIIRKKVYYITFIFIENFSAVLIVMKNNININ